MLRRRFIQYLLSILPIACLPYRLLSADQSSRSAFAEETLEAALTSYFGTQTLIESEDIEIGVRAVIEDGAVVPVKIATDLEAPTQISIFVDKNPNPLVANFNLTPDCTGFISTRIKMDTSAHIIAVVKSRGKIFSQRQFVEVLKGGCG